MFEHCGGAYYEELAMIRFIPRWLFFEAKRAFQLLLEKGIIVILLYSLFFDSVTNSKLLASLEMAFS